MRQFAAFLLLTLGVLLEGCVGCSQPCVLEDDAPLDYGEDAHWLCRPGMDGPCTEDLSGMEVLPDGSTAPFSHETAEDPAVDCFYVYPTMDLRTVAGLHDDLTDLDLPENAARNQAARLSEVCDVWAPAYRQVTLGTYFSRDEALKERCFDTAYADVLAAFQTFLGGRESGRGFALYGHSQGGQHVTRLLDEVVEEDPALASDLVVAMPIGWPVTTAADELVGGSFDTTPVCSAADESGCVVTFRAWAAGRDMPTVAFELAADESLACVHPADEATTDDVPLSRSVFLTNNTLAALPDGVTEEDGYVLYRDLYQASCQREGDNVGLRVSLVGGEAETRTSPVNMEAGLASGSNGLHLVEVGMALGDLIDAVERKAGASSP
jgi:hypothetical protein